MKSPLICFLAVLIAIVTSTLIAAQVFAEPTTITVVSGPVILETFWIEDMIDRDYQDIETVCALAESYRPHDTGLWELSELIVRTAKKYDLRPTFVAQVIAAESEFNPRAVSRCGARGLMQIMPKYHKLRDYHDPAENLDYGCRYLKAQIDQFGSESLALAAYNAGPEKVRKYKGIPPYRETQRYVRRVLNGEKKLRGSMG